MLELSKKDLVSVVIPCYNAALFIKKTLESVLIQTYQELEIIVINDGSTDNSGNCIIQMNSDKIQYVEKDNSGVSDTRNLGLKKYAQGEYILFLDADDVLAPNFLEERVIALKENTAFGGACSEIKKIDKVGKSLAGSFHSLANRDELLGLEANKFTCPSGYLFKTAILKKHKLFFDTDLQSSADKFFLFNFFKYSKILSVPNAPMYYRILSGSMSNNINNKLLNDQKKYLEKLSKEPIIPKKNRRFFLSHVNYTVAGLSLKLRQYPLFLKHTINSIAYSPYRFITLLFKSA